MTYDAKQRALAEMQLRRHEVAYLIQQETALAKANLSWSEARIHDWRAVRFAEALLRYYDERCTQAEAALNRHKEKNAGPRD